MIFKAMSLNKSTKGVNMGKEQDQGQNLSFLTLRVWEEEWESLKKKMRKVANDVG